ncbi:hypothetical protein SanaruYs_39610 [Chryseotalea sanaruensis]|uniref:Uncharacterized protein n=1 Tax=Chryseotalea sanaruensis TaxID=2482724 RepID=A0A401UFP0_9BACT|nr:hypothetical protein [Chryseotalea sanaruensis]GCC53713.1 hypothetical protein SanaruYs_39610 [Chryseotalea sanaruensis]
MIKTPQVLTLLYFYIDGREYAIDGLREAFPFIPNKGDLIRLPKFDNEVLVTKVLHQFYNSDDQVIQNIRIEATTKKEVKINVGVYFEVASGWKHLTGLSEWASRTELIPQKGASITALPEDSIVMGIDVTSPDNMLIVKDVLYRHGLFDVAIFVTKVN